MQERRVEDKLVQHISCEFIDFFSILSNSACGQERKHRISSSACPSGRQLSRAKLARAAEFRCGIKRTFCMKCTTWQFERLQAISFNSLQNTGFPINYFGLKIYVGCISTRFTRKNVQMFKIFAFDFLAVNNIAFMCSCTALLLLYRFWPKFVY